MQPEVFTVPNEKNLIRLWRQSLRNDWLSKIKKEDIFDSAIMIAVMVPGDARQEFTTFVERTDPQGNVRVNKQYYDKYRAQIEQFKSGQADNYAHGTPLSHLPFMDPAMVENLKKLKIFTAEQFETLEGVGLQAVGMGAAQLRDKVRNYMQASKGMAPLQKLADENAELRARLEALEAKTDKKPKKAEAA